MAIVVCKEGVDFSEESGEPTQIHLIVANDAGEWLGWSAAQVIEIKLRDKRRRHIVLAMPAEPRRIDDVALEFHEPHRTEPQLPQRARGMQQIKMRRELRSRDGTRHRETIFEQRPIERFAI